MIVYTKVTPMETSVARLTRLQSTMKEISKRAGIDVAWESPESFHLTVNFLGNLSGRVIPQVRDIVDTIPCGPMVVMLGGVGLFLDAEQLGRGYLVVQIERAELLIDYQAKMLEAFKDQKLYRPDIEHPYKPHITLGCVHRGANRFPPLAQFRINKQMFINGVEIKCKQEVATHG